ncbi:MAG: MBL fold metallo-hydrolase [Acidobacteriia bacterium]|nr:MBL fold metallo-hydrolase [Terriglobia bacterium]MBZ5705425.1 MBL fold metallo-hydrolase [Terriglobia bacterium]
MKRMVRKRGLSTVVISNAICVSLVLALASLAQGASWVTTQRGVTKVADGVYVIIHKDAVVGVWPEGNTTVIIGDRAVFVVDACFLPSSAKEDIAEIKRFTSKPVRYLLNTHFHIDHNAGNSVYKDAFPDVEIIAQTETRRFMDDANPAFAANVADPNGRPSTVTLPALKKELESGMDEDGKALSAEEKATVPQQIAQVENEIAEYRNFKYQTPTITFDHELVLDIGNREVQVEHLGRGNTPGDALVYLPREKVLITGDLLTWPIPYMRMSYPREWVEVLRTMSRMDTDVIVPGHGMLLHDKTYMNEVIALLDSVVKQVHEQAPKVGFNSRTKVPNLEDMHVDLEPFRKSMAGDDPDNNDFWKNIVDPGMLGGVNQGVVGRAYAEEIGRL